jgi:hypothetical protein
MSYETFKKLYWLKRALPPCPTARTTAKSVTVRTVSGIGSSGKVLARLRFLVSWCIFGFVLFPVCPAAMKTLILLGFLIFSYDSPADGGGFLICSDNPLFPTVCRHYSLTYTTR